MKLTVICICILFGLASSGSVLAGKKGGGGGGGGGKAAHAGGGGGGHGAHAGGGGGHGGNAFHGAGASGQHNARSSSHAGGQGAHAGNGTAGHHGLNSHNRAAGHGPNGNGHGGLAGNHNGLHNGNAAHHGNAFHNGNNRFARANGRNWGTTHWRNSHAVFANYHYHAWHDHYWWGSHYNVVEIGGGWGPWYWDGGYWFPAWGYDPRFSYGCDCPVYAYANLPPDQVVVNVQEALQDQGYYAGNIDGQLGQQTRDALGQYQQEHNLEMTSAIDEPTVQALGLNTEQA